MKVGRPAKYENNEERHTVMLERQKEYQKKKYKEDEEKRKIKKIMEIFDQLLSNDININEDTKKQLEEKFDEFISKIKTT